MAAADKIEKYGLTERVLTLSGQGKPTQEIADIITAEGPTTLSQSTVARYLAKVKQRRRDAADQVVSEFIRTELPNDLSVLKQLKQEYLSVRNRLFAYLTGQVASDIGMKIDYDLKNLMALDDRLHDLVKTTLRFVGADGDGDDDKGRHPVDLSKYRKALDDFRENQKHESV